MNDLSSSLLIDTPENILLDAEIAGFGSRCLAAAIDYLFLILLLIALGYLFLRAAPGPLNQSSSFGLFLLVEFALVTFYHLLFELFWNGQTPGKRIIGIRVIRSSGLPLTVSSALIRNLVRLFDFMPLLYGVGLMVMFATKRTQRLGDLAARTVVIREQRKLNLNTLQEDLSVRYQFIKPIEPVPYYVRIDTLNDTDRRLVVDYLRRRPELRQRAQISQMLAHRLGVKMQLVAAGQPPVISYQQSEIFLEHVARAFELAEHAPAE